jgi:hypothetical protein
VSCLRVSLMESICISGLHVNCEYMSEYDYSSCFVQVSAVKWYLCRSSFDEILYFFQYVFCFREVIPCDYYHVCRLWSVTIMF